MWTGVYYPYSYFADGNAHPYGYLHGDASTWLNNFHWNEGPSYSVRLWVFEMPED